MNIQKSIYIFLLVLSFVMFAWGYVRFFDQRNRPKLPQKLLKYLTPLVWFFLVSFVYVGKDRDNICASASIPVILISIILFLSAVKVNRARPLPLIYASDVPDFIQTNGPYQWIRHPFYTSYVLSYLSALVWEPHYFTVIVTVIYFVIYFSAAQREEHLLLNGPKGQEYKIYRDQTGMFIPRIWSKSRF